jgi:hypothetical protein
MIRSLWLCVVAVFCAGSAQAADSVVMPGQPTAPVQHPAEPPPGASVHVAGEQLRLARNAAGQVVELRGFDDAANPYAGQYTAYDRWYWDNYVPAVTPEEEKHFGG